jgi:aminoglycoside 6-adenylyltransferase
MRSDTEILKLITDLTVSDDRVRAVLMNGSRVNPAVVPDEYQDFDIVFIVSSLNTFTDDDNWINVFGEILISQLPDEMFSNAGDPDGFAYLMIFEDGNRIDLKLYPVEKVIANYWPDSLTVCLLDKDNLFRSLPIPGDSDYLIKRPSAKEFRDVCNEFWWVNTYVAKGLLRNEMTYSKEMLESVVRPMFMKMIEWKIGVDNRFSVSFGKAGRNMKKYVSGNYHEKIMQTYSGPDINLNWKALFTMMEIFQQTSNEVADKLNFSVNNEEQENVTRYLRRLCAEANISC